MANRCEYTGRDAFQLVDTALQLVNGSMGDRNARNASTIFISASRPHAATQTGFVDSAAALRLIALLSRLQAMPWSHGLDAVRERAAAFPWRVIVLCGVLYLTLVLLMMPKYLAWTKPFHPHRAADFDLVIPFSVAMLAVLDIVFVARSLPHAPTSRADRVALYVVFSSQLWTAYRLGKYTGQMGGPGAASGQPRAR